MRKLTILGVVMAAMLVPAAAQAQLTLGARLGYAWAGGSAGKDVDGVEMKMSDRFSGAIPFEFDLGYTFGQDFNLGLYASYGVVQLKSSFTDSCKADGVTCSAGMARFGIQGTYTFNSASPSVAPWVALGTGAESMVTKGEAGGLSATDTLSGWELLNLQVGADMKSAGKFRWGPFAAYSFGQYSKEKIEVSGQGSLEGDIPTKTTHTFLQIGLRGYFSL